MKTRVALSRSDNREQQLGARPAVFGRRAFLVLVAAFVAGLVAGLAQPSLRTAYAKTKHVKVRVYDQNRKGVGDKLVHIYRVTPPSDQRCECDGNSKCKLMMVAAEETNNGGLAKITGLSPNTKYQVCIDPVCELDHPECIDPKTACDFEGNCDEVTTNESGGASRTIELVEE